MRALPCLIPSVIALAAATGCTMAPTAIEPAIPPTQAAQCQADPAQALIGQKASNGTGARALVLTGARTLRWGPPGAIFTMDYRTDRVNILYDAAMAITEIRCG